MSNILEWPYRPRPRIKIKRTIPVSALHAMSNLVREPTLTARDIQKFTQEADAFAAHAERMCERARALGQIISAASYRMIADDAHLVASRIEAPTLEPIR